MPTELELQQLYALSCGPTVLLAAAYELGVRFIPYIKVPGLSQIPNTGWPLTKDRLLNYEYNKYYQTILFYISSGLSRHSYPKLNQIKNPPHANTLKDRYSTERNAPLYQVVKELATGSQPHDLCLAAKHLNLNAELHISGNISNALLNTVGKNIIAQCNNYNIPTVYNKKKLNENERALKLVLTNKKYLSKPALHWILSRPESSHIDNKYMDSYSKQGFKKFHQCSKAHYLTLGLNIILSPSSVIEKEHIKRQNFAAEMIQKQYRKNQAHKHMHKPNLEYWELLGGCLNSVRT